MNILKDKYIILEIIPTNLKHNGGIIIQLSALKIEGLKLIDRFDYRINDDKLPFKEFKDWINYDNDYFTYVESDSIILDEFKKYSKGLPLLILDNSYTKDYFSEFNNNIESILKYINMEYHDKVIEDIIEKYNIEPTNHIVDILYEALMMHN